MSLFMKVQVWIYRQDEQNELEVLLLKLTPERGGFWQPVTGGVDPGEALNTAALREATEETGLPYAQAPVPLDYSFQFFSPRHQSNCEEHAFSLEVPHHSKKEEVRLDSREHTEFKWVPASLAERELKHPSNAEALRRLIQKKVARSTGVR
jgi:8-oxo-dGTP pyrophosphatase MutT (NUDIX family)